MKRPSKKLLVLGGAIVESVEDPSSNLAEVI